MLPAEVFAAPLQISIKILTPNGWGTEMQDCWYTQSFRTPGAARNMDNRFPPAEREAWIILFIVNTGEA